MSGSKLGNLSHFVGILRVKLATESWKQVRAANLFDNHKIAHRQMLSLGCKKETHSQYLWSAYSSPSLGLTHGGTEVNNTEKVLNLMEFVIECKHSNS